MRQYLVLSGQLINGDLALPINFSPPILLVRDLSFNDPILFIDGHVQSLDLIFQLLIMESVASLKLPVLLIEVVSENPHLTFVVLHFLSELLHCIIRLGLAG